MLVMLASDATTYGVATDPGLLARDAAVLLAGATRGD